MKNKKLKSVFSIVFSIILFSLMYYKQEFNLPNCLAIFFSGMIFYKGIANIFPQKEKSIKEYSKIESTVLLIAFIIAISIVLVTFFRNPFPF